MDLIIVNFALTLTRCASFVAFSPHFGDREIPRLVKLGLAVALTCFWFDPLRSPDTTLLGADGFTALAAFVLVVRELLLGAALGYLFQLILLPARLAGSYIGQEMGLNMATVADPTSPMGVNLIGRILELTALLVFLCLNVHHTLLIGLHTAVQAVPVGTPFDASRWSLLIPKLGQAHAQGMLIAAPAGVCLFVLSGALVMLTRATPQMNLFSIGFPLRILAGLLSLLFFFPNMLQMIGLMLEQAQDVLWEVFG